VTVVFLTPAAADSWRVRIIRPDDVTAPAPPPDPEHRQVCGAGVLLTSRHVLTCAHVVATALGGDPGGPRPGEAVLVDFPALPSAPPRPARVAADGWAQQRLDHGGDLAILELDGGPLPGIFPPRLARCGVPGRRRVRVYGHPAVLPEGWWSVGELIGAGGQSSEWVQLQVDPGGRPIAPGYSGAGVMDEETGAVIGCIVTVLGGPEQAALSGTAWMIPLETVAYYWPPLAASLEDDAGPPGEADEYGPEEQQLAMSMVMVELLRDRRSRDLCLSQLSRQLRLRLPARRYLGDYEEVRALAGACLTMPGLMAELLEILEQAMGRAPELTRLAALASQLIPEPLLRRTERSELYAILADVRLDGLEELYREAVGVLGRPLRAQATSLPAIVQQLEDATYGPHGGPPLLYFLGRVAGRLPAANGARLDRWLAEVSDRLQVPGRIGPGVPGGMSPGPAPGPAGRPWQGEHFCITDLTPDLLDPDQYRFTIWFQASPDQELVIGGGDEERIRLDEVPGQLDAALASLPPGLATSRRRQTYEFILPRHLLGHAVDQWRTGLGEVPHRFSMVSPVIVRSQDRLRSYQMQEHWRPKWQWLRSNSGTASPEAVYWLDNRGPVSAESVLSVLVEDDRRVCVVFRRPPGEVADPDGDAVMAALAGGAPIMIWCRDPASAEVAYQEIRRLLDDGGLADLPERVRQLRNHAIQMGDPAGHPGLNLTLFWDDADRVPRAYRVQ
jgi:vWA-MoxR associated protein C-terminal domain/vWA-MoxR associated protein middle region 0/Trypsin-like peptidase domain/Effector-associated domain 2